MEFIEYPDSEMMMIDLANQLAGELENCLFNHDHASLAVPGGTTPGPVFDALCAADLDWSRVHVMLTDERWVPETSDRSNTRLLKERLFTARAAKAQFVPFYTGHATPEDGLDEIAKRLKGELPISVMLLGMGEDMHTASLFPGADRLDDGLAANAPPVLPMRAAGAPEPRVTLTAPVLEGAMSTHVLIKGAAKKTALEGAHGLSRAQAPINTVLKNAKVHWAET
ncbi:6-phosphogluconolactonase [Nereida sp. MMG025]|uniref:6-phosphogluconolactonase n=1 Tax=Nereida sp. MMG025 TaxID=2909981 RepID=UPI001F0190A0|nr:6-phosphogluconolactonase [Nereida sp. MMG025]MCF6443369.1 6-phosphogluconolactonase [Nereida sp. MMG025]